MDEYKVAEIMSAVVVNLQGLYSSDPQVQIKALDEAINNLEKQRTQLQAQQVYQKGIQGLLDKEAVNV